MSHIVYGCLFKHCDPDGTYRFTSFDDTMHDGLEGAIKDAVTTHNKVYGQTLYQAVSIIRTDLETGETITIHDHMSILHIIERHEVEAREEGGCEPWYAEHRTDYYNNLI